MYIYIYLEAMGISYLSCLRLCINDILSQQCSAFHIQAKFTALVSKVPLIAF